MKTTLITAAAVTLGAGTLSLATLHSTEASAAAPVAPIADGPFAVDGVHSTVMFGVDYFRVSRFYGRFNTVSGSYYLDLANPSASTLEITVDAESVDTANEDRDKHIRNPDFFAAREYPQISFTGKNFTKIDDETIRVTGDLSFRGKTTTVSADLTYFGDGPDAWGNNRSGFEGTFSIDRSEFGSTYGIEAGALSDQDDLTVATTGTRK